MLDALAVCLETGSEDIKLKIYFLLSNIAAEIGFDYYKSILNDSLVFQMAYETMLAQNCASKLNIEATYVVANLIATSSDAIIDRI